MKIKILPNEIFILKEGFSLQYFVCSICLFPPIIYFYYGLNKEALINLGFMLFSMVLSFFYSYIFVLYILANVLFAFVFNNFIEYNVTGEVKILNTMDENKQKNTFSLKKINKNK